MTTHRLVVEVTHAFPFNAGGCPRGIPAVSNSVHTALNPESNGFLEAGSLTAEIDGIALLTGGNPIQLKSNEVHTISVTGGPSGTFRGILIRTEVGSKEITSRVTTNVFPAPPLETITLDLQMDSSNDINVITSSACQQENNFDTLRVVDGLSHNNNDDKTSMEGEIFMIWPSEKMGGQSFQTTIDGRIDITVVIQNSGGSSIYYHSGYDIIWTYEAGDSSNVLQPDTSISTVNYRDGCNEQGSQLTDICLNQTSVDFQQDCVDCIDQIALSFAGSVPGDPGTIPSFERQENVCDGVDVRACQTIRGCSAICGPDCPTEIESYGACVLSFERNDVGNPTCGPISCNADDPVTIPSTGTGTGTDTTTTTTTEPEPEATTVSSSPTVSAQPSSPSLTILVPQGSEEPSSSPSVEPSSQPSGVVGTPTTASTTATTTTTTTDAPATTSGGGTTGSSSEICVNQPCLISNGGTDCCATSPTCRTVGDPTEGVGQCVFTVGGTTSSAGGAGEREERPGSSETDTNTGTGTGTRRQLRQQSIRRRMDAVAV